MMAEERQRRDRVTVCGYLVDTYCLGVKNALGPPSMPAGELDAFVADYFDAHGEPPLPVGLDLVQHLVFGAVEYAGRSQAVPIQAAASRPRPAVPWPCRVRQGGAGLPDPGERSLIASFICLD